MCGHVLCLRSIYFAKGKCAPGLACAKRWRRSWLIRPPPPWPPLCKGESAGFVCAVRWRRRLVDSAPTPLAPPFARGESAGFACARRLRRSWLIRPPPPLAPPLCKGGEVRGFRLRGAVATELVDPAPTPPGPPFARGGGKVRVSFARCGAATGTRTDPAPPPWPPFCKGKVGGFRLHAYAWQGSWLIRPPPPWPPLCKGGKVRVDPVYSSAQPRPGVRRHPRAAAGRPASLVGFSVATAGRRFDRLIARKSSISWTLAYSYVFPCYFVRRSQGDSGGGELDDGFLALFGPDVDQQNGRLIDVVLNVLVRLELPAPIECRG